MRTTTTSKAGFSPLYPELSLLARGSPWPHTAASARVFEPGPSSGPMAGTPSSIPRARLHPPACCADGFLSLSSRAFWRPGGWENMCRLLCHCVRHIGLDNKHGRSVKAIHSFLSRWTVLEGLHGALCRLTARAVRQEELDGERESPKVLTEVSEVHPDAVSSPQV